MSSLRVLLADDELQARKRLVRLLEAMPEVEVIAACASAEELLAKLPSEKPDVLLLDIQMPGLSGLEARALLPADAPYVIFVTAFPEHALEAFDLGAVDYVLKPVRAERLARAIDRARRRSAGPLPDAASGRLAIDTRQGILLLDPAELVYAGFDGALVTLQLATQAVVTDQTLTALEAKLPRQTFERVHRRFLLNLDQVIRFEPEASGGYTAFTRTKHRVPVSRQVARDLRKRLGL